MPSGAKREATSNKSAASPAQIYTPGQSPEKDAWFTSFFIENHLDYFTNPEKAASDEQVRFMVYTGPNERYYPCSDKMFGAIILRDNSAHIQKTYNQVLQRILSLIERQIEDPWEKAYLESLIINKYQHETRDEIMLPVAARKTIDAHLPEPHPHRRSLHGTEGRKQPPGTGSARRAGLSTGLQSCGRKRAAKPPQTLGEIKSQIAALEFQRLLCLANSPELWQSPRETPLTEAEHYLSLFAKPITGDRPPASARLPGLRAAVSAQERAKSSGWPTNRGKWWWTWPSYASWYPTATR
jgi:hypothetical protein